MTDKIVKFLQDRNIEVSDHDNEIANLFLGALVVGQLDYWFDRSCDFIDNDKPQKPFEREWSEIAKQDKAYRSCFSHLDNETKIQLKKLIKESIEGVLFSALLRLDQSPIGKWKIELETQGKIVTANSGNELHEDLYKWIDLFGKK